MVFLNYDRINSIKLNELDYIKETFPKITVSYLPQETLIMLKRVYSGNKSELTSIMQYMYQNFVISRDTKLSNLANTMEKIAICEMRHYELLAKILVKCGIDPKNCVYIDSNPNLCDYWKASSVSYEKSLVKMFENNIVLEERAIQDYMEIITKTDNENLKQVLERLIQDEQSHKAYFMAILTELKK